jgi:hypothetical protein
MAVGCALIGPPGAGKSSLVVALARACQLPERGGLEVRCLLHQRSAAGLAEVVRAISEGQGLGTPTNDVEEFGLEVRLSGQNHGWWRRQFGIRTEMKLLDVPGEALFGQASDDSGNHSLLVRVRAARLLVLCVDAVRPQSDLWQEKLPRIVDQLAERGTDGSQRLQFDRVVILCTRIDQLCEDAVQAFASTYSRVQAGEPETPHSEIGRRVSRWRPADLARALDPLAQARELVGVPVLEVVAAAMRPGAELAVALTSAGGFDPQSGEAFLDLVGMPRRGPWESGEETLARWRPFGLRETLQFLIAGRVGRTMATLARSDLWSDARPQASAAARCSVAAAAVEMEPER